MSGILPPLPALILMVVAACGGGAWIQRFARVDDILPPGQTLASAFVLGMGVLGWLSFLLGLAGELRPAALVFLCLVLASGFVLLRRPLSDAFAGFYSPTGWQILIISCILIALFFDILEALAPPSDADSLAYHFALPREFLAAGAIPFTQRALDNGLPLLQHMSFTVALGIGGERTLTLWAMLSGWGTTAILYILARTHLSRGWSMALALVFLTTPAVVYGGGTGQVELPCAGFAVAAVLFAMAARRHNKMSFAALAGLTAGFFAASKYTGSLFLLFVGFVLVAHRQWLKFGAAYTAAALLVIVPPYGWIWWNTGDPVYPVLYGILDYKPDIMWSPDFQAEFRKNLASERALPTGVLWALVYPFLATLAPDSIFESDRTGFGPFALLVLPLALAGFWARRKTVWHSPLWTVAFVCAAFYLAWFLIGASQRVRHFLPVYPLLLLCLTVASVRACQAWPSTIKPLSAAVALTAGLQLTIHAVFTLKYAQYVFSHETREAFLSRNIGSYSAVASLKAHLRKEDRLLYLERQLAYYLPLTYFRGHHAIEPRIDLRPSARDVGRFWDELAAERITHLFVTPFQSNSPQGGYEYLADQLVKLGCARKEADFESVSILSRTISKFTQTRVHQELLALTPLSCPLERDIS